MALLRLRPRPPKSPEARQLYEDVSRALAHSSILPNLGEVKRSVMTADTYVDVGELLRINARAASVVRLPLTAKQDLGALVTIWVDAASAAVQALAPQKATINGSQAQTLSTGLNLCVLVNDSTWWT